MTSVTRRRHIPSADLLDSRAPFRAAIERYNLFLVPTTDVSSYLPLIHPLFVYFFLRRGAFRHLPGHRIRRQLNPAGVSLPGLQPPPPRRRFGASARAASANVAPVVRTSSTMMQRRPATRGYRRPGTFMDPLTRRALAPRPSPFWPPGSCSSAARRRDFRITSTTGAQWLHPSQLSQQEINRAEPLLM